MQEIDTTATIVVVAISLTAVTSVGTIAWKVRDWIGNGFGDLGERMSSVEQSIVDMKTNTDKQVTFCNKRFERNERILNGKLK